MRYMVLYTTGISSARPTVQQAGKVRKRQCSRYLIIIFFNYLENVWHLLLYYYFCVASLLPDDVIWDFNNY